MAVFGYKGGIMYRYLVFCYFATPPYVLLIVRANHASTARMRAKRFCVQVYTDMPTRTKTIGIDTTLACGGETEYIATFN